MKLFGLYCDVSGLQNEWYISDNFRLRELEKPFNWAVLATFING